MCPACVASAALLIAGAISTGGLTAAVVKTLGARDAAGQSIQQSKSKEEKWQK